MNKTVELVNSWATFEESHPQSGISDFCRYYLISHQKQESNDIFLHGVVPPGGAAVLIKLMTLIIRMFNIYFHAALKNVPIKQVEEFYFLTTIKNLKSPKKTEVIFHTVNEISNGLNILNSLIKQKYVTEHDDQYDKRTKRLTLTPKGKKVLEVCYEKIHLVNEMMFMEMPADDIKLCIELLKNIETKFSDKWMKQKTMPFHVVFESVTGKKITNKTITKNILAKRR